MAFIDISTVKNIKLDERNYIKTGLNLIDRKILGLGLGQVSIMSGINGSGKSTVIGQFLLNAVNSGYKVALFSGELPNHRAKDWLFLQAAGRNNVVVLDSKYSDKKFYTVPQQTEEKIDKWWAGKLFIDDNSSFDIQVLGRNIREIIEKDADVKFIVIDNLMALDIKKLNSEKYEAQKQLILTMCIIAKKYNVHIMVVAHPTKAMSFIRKENISGSSDIGNAVDTIFICHRNTTDFKKRSQEYFGWRDSHSIYESDNVIEICKNRDFGEVDVMCPFLFEKETKRFLNFAGENKKYKWDESYSQVELKPVDEDFDLPF